MDFVAEVTDLGAPEYAVSGVACVERITFGQVRISKFSRRKDGNLIVFHEVWDYKAWLRMVSNYQDAARIIDGMAAPNGDNNERSGTPKH